MRSELDWNVNIVNLERFIPISNLDTFECKNQCLIPYIIKL